MQADIITIGDELLIGQTINTNSAWIGKELSKLGMGIGRSITISDGREEILSALDESLRRSDLVIVTGGLGPTKDDITKETLCEFFDTELIMHPPVLERIRLFFEKRGREMLNSNMKQAELPASCLVLDNFLGTASGMWFEREGKVLVSIPGVPYEMKALMENEVLPRVQSFFSVSGMYHQTLMTQGIGESFLVEKIRDWEDRIYADGMGLAYLPSPGVVKLRITSKKGPEDAPRIEAYFKELEERLPQYVYGRNGATILEVVGDVLRQRGKTLGTVESCTGGGIAAAFVAIPGASDYFQGGLVTYSNALKMNLAHVNESTLISHGAVSEQVVGEMAANGRATLGVDYCIAVSGVAGPDGGTEEKPVGLVWCAVAGPDSVITRQFQFGSDRGRNIEMTILSATNVLRRLLLNQFDG
jgi:nicotinamide-nucleotide amidase